MRQVETVMGIPMSVDIPDGADHNGTDHTVPLRAAFGLLHAADRRFSTYRDDSEVAMLGRGQLDGRDYSDDLREVLAIAADAERASHGAFSMRVPGRPVDLNGVVKGWAVQRAADILVDAGIENFCFNAGGDVVVRGAPPGQESWNVGVRSPWDPTAMTAVLAMTDGAVATSGTYERGEHILDGRTGQPATVFASVTVTAASLTTADVLATAVFALGREGLAWALDNGGQAVLAVAGDGEVLIAGNLPLASAD